MLTKKKKDKTSRVELEILGLKYYLSQRTNGSQNHQQHSSYNAELRKEKKNQINSCK